ncbi:hypothetical protein [Desulfobacter latus]|nr:hypothetical protein [Desulfobacter latus]
MRKEKMFFQLKRIKPIMDSIQNIHIIKVDEFKIIYWQENSHYQQ